MSDTTNSFATASIVLNFDMIKNIIGQLPTKTVISLFKHKLGGVSVQNIDYSDIDDLLNYIIELKCLKDHNDLDTEKFKVNMQISYRMGQVVDACEDEVKKKKDKIKKILDEIETLKGATKIMSSLKKELYIAKND